MNLKNIKKILESRLMPTFFANNLRKIDNIYTYISICLLFFIHMLKANRVVGVMADQYYLDFPEHKLRKTVQNQ